MSAVLEPITKLTEASPDNNLRWIDGPPVRLNVKNDGVSQSAPTIHSVSRESRQKWGWMIIVGIICLLCFATYEYARAFNPRHQQQTNAQWVNLLIHNFNNDTPITPFNGNQWGQF